MGGLGRKGLPARDFSGKTSGDAGKQPGVLFLGTSSSTFRELLARWPFLFSRPLIKTPLGN
jgi:hypothetical protein